MVISTLYSKIGACLLVGLVCCLSGCSTTATRKPAPKRNIWADARHQPYDRELAREQCPYFHSEDPDSLPLTMPVHGQILGEPFRMMEASFQDGILNLRQTEREGEFSFGEVSIVLLNPKAIQAGHVLHIPLEAEDSARTANMHLALLNKETRVPDTVVTNRFNLWLSIDQLNDSFIRGRVIACIPGEPLTRIRGKFKAERLFEE